MPYRVREARNMYLFSRPVGTNAPWTAHHQSMTFAESELVYDPWQHLVDLTPEEKKASGPFGLARRFTDSTFTFHRDEREYIAQWCDVEQLLCP